MRCVVFVFHGSPVRVYNEDVEKFRESLISVFPSSIKIDFAFLEHRSPLLSEKILELSSDERFSQFFIEPMFFFRANHMTNDIEPKVRALSLKQKLLLQPPLSERASFAELYRSYISDYISEHIGELTQRTLFIFVGRGSSDANASGDFYRFARIVWEKLGKIGDISLAFAEVTKPSVLDVLSKVKLEVYDNIIIVPFLLFRGYVERKIEKDCKTFFQGSAFEFNIIPPIGYGYREKLAEYLAKPYV